jgi:peroxiredoxin
MSGGARLLSAQEPPSTGGKIPEFKLQIPKEQSEKTYLGLSGKGTFLIQDIKARLVLIEIFSMYCPFCQKDAPNVNALFTLIEKDPHLKSKIKILGIGVGNSLYEVGIFKKRYTIEFPLFSDQDFTIHKLFGEVRTPYFIAVRISESGDCEIIYSKLGSFGEPHPFLEMLKKSAGL